MASIGMSKKDLQQAMRDPRGWDGAHPEREAYGAWVGEAWKTLDDAGALDGDGTTVVQVKGYHRTRKGKREWVGPYEQTRKAAEAENDNAALVEVRGEGPASAALPPVAGTAPPQLATVFIGGGGDSKFRNVRDYAGINASAGFAAAFRGVGVAYFPWDDSRGATQHIRDLRIRHPGIRIHLIGHSYGGDTAAQIAAGLSSTAQPIDLLVTIDPVGRGTSSDFFARVRDGARRWINVNATGGGWLEQSNIVAGIGGAWNYGPMGYADEFLNAPVPHAAFSSMMRARLPDGRSIEREVAGR